jgi:hypothetical protein
MVLNTHNIVVLSMLLAATAVIRESCVCCSGSVWDSTPEDWLVSQALDNQERNDRRLDADVDILKF